MSNKNKQEILQQNNIEDLMKYQILTIVKRMAPTTA